VSTKARLGIDITAVDRTRAAFAQANRNLTGLTSNVRRTIGDINKLRTVFAAAFVGLGVRAAVESIGRAVDKNLVQGADRMQSRWSTAWDSWGNTADRLITEASMGLSGMIDDASTALGLVSDLNSQSVNRSGQGNFITAPPGATYGKGLPNNVTEMNKVAQSFQSVNTLTKESAAGYKELTAAKVKMNAVDKETWNFQTDILQGLDEEIAMLQAQAAAYGRSVGVMEAYAAKQRAINEIIRQGRQPTAEEIRQIEQKTAAIRQLVDQSEQLKSAQAEMKEFTDTLKEGFSGFFQQIAQGTSVTKALKDELTSLSQRLLQMATDKIFDMILNFVLQSQEPGGGGMPIQLPSFASGGTLGAGKWGIAGEGGEPELIHGPARITPFSKLGGGGQTSVNVYNMGSGTATVKESGFGDQRRVDVYVRDRMAQEGVNPSSPFSRVLGARGAGVPVKNR
jgi:uncharacterized coiled-coil DUF342 family protein